MEKLNKKQIVVGKDDFETAQDKETCLIWAEEFLKRDVSLSEEVEEIEGAIKNERLWRSGAENNMERDMRNDNLTNLNAYLGWLKTLENRQENVEVHTTPRGKKDLQGYSIVQLQDGESGYSFATERGRDFYDVASVYCREVGPSVGEVAFEDLLYKFGDVDYIPERIYETLEKAMDTDDTVRAVVVFNFEDDTLSVRVNGEDAWRTYDLQCIKNAVEQAESQDSLSGTDKRKQFESFLVGQELDMREQGGMQMQ